MAVSTALSLSRPPVGLYLASIDSEMSKVDPTTTTPYANLDWDHYNESRPVYPQSLKKLIYNYRHAHPEGRWERMVDVGGGVGISTTIFVSDFDVVHLLDPSPLNHEKARLFLGDWIDRHNFPTKLDFIQSTAEEGHKLVRDADLVICAESAHFIDPDSLAISVARMLRPAGTLAIYSYWIPTFPDQSKLFSDTFCKAVTRTLRLCVGPDDGDTRSLFCKTVARVSTGNGVLDSVPVAPEYFQDVQRVRINPEAEKVMETFKTTFPVSYEPIQSRVREEEGEFSYDSRKDPEADGWCFSVDNKWLHNFMTTLRPADIKLTEEQYEDIYGEWDGLFVDECPSGSTRALWPVNLVLATRR